RGRLIGVLAGRHVRAAQVADAEDECAEGGHDAELLGADFFAEELEMTFDGEAGRHFERRPERPLVRADLRVADDDVAAEGIFLRDELECLIDLVEADLPCHERTLREIRGEEGLPYAADYAAA